MALVGIVGVRLVWVATVFVASPDFGTLMLVYPASLGINAIGVVGICFFLKKRQPGGYFGLPEGNA